MVRVVAGRRGAHKVEYSREDGRTLWDGGDRVEHADAGSGGEQYSFYVTLHHFGGEGSGRIGQHVALAPRDIVKFCGFSPTQLSWYASTLVSNVFLSGLYPATSLCRTNMFTRICRTTSRKASLRSAVNTITALGVARLATTVTVSNASASRRITAARAASASAAARALAPAASVAFAPAAACHAQIPSTSPANCVY
jgi:hypothetical protein